MSSLRFQDSWTKGKLNSTHSTFLLFMIDVYFSILFIFSIIGKLCQLIITTTKKFSSGYKTQVADTALQTISVDGFELQTGIHSSPFVVNPFHRKGLRSWC